MAADLSIHIKTDEVTENDLRVFFSHVLGSKYCNLFFGPRFSQNEEDKAYKAISQSPSIWIGEVSWLKAALMEDNETFVPNAVQKVSGYIGEDLPELTDELIDKILGALISENKTSYKVARVEEVKEFLNQHKGKQVFTVSW